ncbi:hypothetical protein Q5P01_005374 [Channa striata]|uniref:Uncharacterized protein n=1 Tax=Channa striata TaxID=64152 RepID=A0AA88NDE3_CHASR|nr:hypothetical protein Q5P01_005374 [Channa striata]
MSGSGFERISEQKQELNRLLEWGKKCIDPPEPGGKLLVPLHREAFFYCIICFFYTHYRNICCSTCIEGGLLSSSAIYRSTYHLVHLKSIETCDRKNPKALYVRRRVLNSILHLMGSQWREPESRVTNAWTSFSALL